MRTTRAFSTVTYNSEKFLKSKLDDLVARDILQFYVYNFHYAEADESKDHFNIYMIPNGRVDTNQIRAELEEYDPDNPTKPIRPLPFVNSSFGDWYLYHLHDRAYLASKGQSRKYHYKSEEFKTSEPDFLNELAHQIDYSKLNGLGKILDAINQGLTFDDFIKTNPVPLASIRSVEFLFSRQTMKRRDELMRAGRKTHSPLEEEYLDFNEF